jgi:hypothetical protein
MQSAVSRTVEAIDNVTLKEALAPMANGHPNQIVRTQIVAIPTELKKILEEGLLLPTRTAHTISFLY